MTYDPLKHHRRTIRLKVYDYTRPGAYFVTLVTQDRACLFGEVTGATVALSPAGLLMQTLWQELAVFYPGVSLDAFIVMPNHLHGIIVLCRGGPLWPPSAPDGQSPAPTSPALSVPDVVARYKALTTRRYIDGVNNRGWPIFRNRLWGWNYYEHIVRHEADLDRIRRYIQENPLRWALDGENLDRL